MTQPQHSDRDDLRSPQATQPPATQPTNHELARNMAQPTPNENVYREGYMHGRYSEVREEEARARQEEARLRQEQLRATQGSQAASGLLLGFLTLVGLGGIFAAIFVFGQSNNTPTPPPERETETNTTIERTIERTQELLPIPQQDPPAQEPQGQILPDFNINVTGGSDAVEQPSDTTNDSTGEVAEPSLEGSQQ